MYFSFLKLIDRGGIAARQDEKFEVQPAPLREVLHGKTLSMVSMWRRVADSFWLFTCSLEQFAQCVERAVAGDCNSNWRFSNLTKRSEICGLICLRCVGMRRDRPFVADQDGTSVRNGARAGLCTTNARAVSHVFK